MTIVRESLFLVIGVASLCCSCSSGPTAPVTDIELVTSRGILRLATIPDGVSNADKVRLLQALRNDSIPEIQGRSVLVLFFKESDRVLATNSHIETIRSEPTGKALADTWRQAVVVFNRGLGPRGYSLYGSLGHPANPNHEIVFKSGPLADEMIRRARETN